MDLETTLGWSKRHFDETRSCAYLYFKQGSFDIARKFFQALVLLDPNSIYDQLMLGSSLLELDETKQALQCFNHVLDLKPDHTQALFLRFKALLALQDNIQAQEIGRMLLQSSYRGKVIALGKTYHLPLMI